MTGLSSKPLADRYEAFLLDLDGVVYRGSAGIPGAAEAIAGLRERGRRVVFLTNNSARTPEQVAGKLAGMGVEAAPGDVVTSAQAAASLVAAEMPGASAFVVGEEGVTAALAAEGLRVAETGASKVDAVVVGWDRAADYDKLRDAAVHVLRGARFVATNTDASYPAPGGELWPGAGALVAAIETATGRRAESAGKPEGALFETALARAGTRDTLVVGDRIETDIAGAERAGLDALLVLSGAAGRADLLDGGALPVAVAADLAGVLEPAIVARVREARESDGVADLLHEAGLAAEPSDGATFVAGEDQVTGTASVVVREGDAYLHSVAVKREARGREVGTLVVSAAWHRAVLLGVRRAFLLTEEAEGFFARLGFGRVDRRALPAWVSERSRACSQAAVAMTRDVRG